MSDSSSDEYHEDPLPDLVLSSSYPREEISRFYAREDVSGYLETREDEDEDEERTESINYSLPPDLLCGEEQLNLEQEYFASGDQVFLISQKDSTLKKKRGMPYSQKYLYKFSQINNVEDAQFQQFLHCFFSIPGQTKLEGVLL